LASTLYQSDLLNVEVFVFFSGDWMMMHMKDQMGSDLLMVLADHDIPRPWLWILEK
jgi:hypothetical protein